MTPWAVLVGGLLLLTTLFVWSLCRAASTVD